MLAWVFRKNGSAKCTACKRIRRREGDPDPCLGKVPGVVNACCGHGVGEGYMIFENGMAISFEHPLIKRIAGKAPFERWEDVTSCVTVADLAQ
jgi:hypothetical protein